MVARLKRSAPRVRLNWETGSHLVTLQAVSLDKERLLLFLPHVDELARSLRWVKDIEIVKRTSSACHRPDSSESPSRRARPPRTASSINLHTRVYVNTMLA